MEGEFTGAGAQTMGAADVAGQQSGQEAAAQAQVQQQPVNVPDAQGQGTQEETFDSLIRGRYKQDFDSAVQKVVKQRVRGLNQYKGQVEAMAPIIDQLGALYGIDTSDPRKFINYMVNAVQRNWVRDSMTEANRNRLLFPATGSDGIELAAGMDGSPEGIPPWECLRLFTIKNKEASDGYETSGRRNRGSEEEPGDAVGDDD